MYIAIWELADQDKDNQLNAKEFCVAFHLIICISKRKLPLPVTLPPPLMNFLARAPMIPNAVTAAAATATHGIYVYISILNSISSFSDDYISFILEY